MQTCLRIASYTLFFVLSTSCLLAQTGILGTVLDEIGEPIIGGSVSVFEGEGFITGAATDFDGHYKLNLDPGYYHIEFSYVGYDSQRIQDFQVIKDSIAQLPFTFTQTAHRLGEKRGGFNGCIYQPNPIDVRETTQGMIIHSRELRRVSKPN